MTNIPLSSRVAAWLITAQQILGGIGTLILTTNSDQMPWGWDAYDVGLALMIAAQVTTIITVALRKNAVPGVTSGVGTE